MDGTCGFMILQFLLGDFVKRINCEENQDEKEFYAYSVFIKTA